MNRKTVTYLTIFITLLFLGAFLLRNEFPVFLRWYLVLFIMGIGLFPFTAFLFESFEDHGWLFGKVIAIASGGYVSWLLVTGGLQQFTSRRCIVITLIIFGICWFYFTGKPYRRLLKMDMILTEEIIFLAFLLMWTYFFCFRPEAYGTEKYMDYGFMVSMERSIELPAKDMWYGLSGINYYYGGQYFAVYLSKLCYLPVRYTYNLMRASVAAFAFAIPFSIVYHMLRSRLQKQNGAAAWSIAGGCIAGAAVSLAGNVHYVLYGLFGKVFRLQGYLEYWWPHSTRYIGHNPKIEADECIHEFPSYSFVLGDLHAHMLNIIFVLTIIGLLYCWIRQVRRLELARIEQERIRQEQQLHRPSKFKGEKSWKIFLRRNGLEAPLLVAGGLVGLCKFTNYWDYVIYFTVTAFVCVMVALYRYHDSPVRAVGSVVLHMGEALVLSQVIPLPFVLNFYKMVSGVGISVYHTAPYQFAILWGLPAAVCFLLFVIVILEYRKQYAGMQMNAPESGYHPITDFFQLAPQSDRFALTMGICALGLVILPELVYVRDIYGGGFSRANTMFKLTYQAYILFALIIGYALIRLLAVSGKLIVRIATIILMGIFALTLGYLPYSVKEWFGNVTDRNRFAGLDATTFMYSVYPEDAGAIDWLRTYVKGQPLVLEASGDSYSDYCRVSALTGLPTLEGWHDHEWLWRGDTKDLDAKNEDIRSIYEAGDPDSAARLMTKYGISYLFVGSCEHEKYVIHDDVLQEIGEVIFRDGSTYIVQFMTGEEDESV